MQKILVKSKINNMRTYFLLLVLVLALASCSRSYESPYEYDNIKLYEYNKRPWDEGANLNKVYSTALSEEDSVLYTKIEKLNYSLKESFKPNAKSDSILFKEKYEVYRPKPTCPAGYKHILILYNKSKIKYIVKFNENCNECFLIDLNKGKSYFIKVGYNEFIKLLEKENK